MESVVRDRVIGTTFNPHPVPKTCFDGTIGDVIHVAIVKLECRGEVVERDVRAIVKHRHDEFLVVERGIVAVHEDHLPDPLEIGVGQEVVQSTSEELDEEQKIHEQKPGQETHCCGSSHWHSGAICW